MQKDEAIQIEISRVCLSNEQYSFVEKPESLWQLKRFLQQSDSKSWLSSARLTSAGRASRCTKSDGRIVHCLLCLVWHVGTLESNEYLHIS